ncbi:MAG: DUF6465 family protein [Lachnospiraceae bacterium]|nr:DUF6465 family protein [Lachnospiraceae bacterium]
MALTKKEETTTTKATATATAAKAEVKPATKTTTVKTDTDTKATTAKAEEKTVTKPVAKKTTAVKKTTAKKTTAAKTTKAAAKVGFFVEYGGQQVSQDDLMNKIKADLEAKGAKATALKAVDVYAQPENNVVYYVSNAGTAKEIKGEVSFF